MQKTRSYDKGPGTKSDETSPSALARGASVHRYMILDLVAEGGMGVVYAAYDPVLDRRVALKFLRADPGNRSAVREKRLLREAQAMARLSHPNAAVVYEVATFEGRVFLAMEFVDGVDLRTWLVKKPRSFQEILEMFRAAGRGLAAAHAAGIMHRDFKPENVLVDEHGRPRVTDFGLSRALREQDERGPREEDPMPTADPVANALSAPSHLSQSLTRTGGVIGTPLYMSPEQYEGDVLDVRSDQFSFCVALYEALYKELPFPGNGPAERIANAVAGKVAPARAQSSVPLWCRQALLRGLAAAPENRFASMDALLGALSPRPRASRWRLAVSAALAVVLAGASAYAFLIDQPAVSLGPTCDQGAQQLAGIWDPAHKGRLAEAFRQSGARGTDATWKGFSAIVDQRANAWIAMHDETCAATHKRGVQSPDILDLRMECLERKRQEMKALVEVYGEKPDAKALDRAAVAADKLSSVAACADVGNLRAVVPVPEDSAVRENVRSLRQRLARSSALMEAGRYKQGQAYMASLKQEADAIGYAPLAAEAAIALAIHLRHGGKRQEAEKVLFEAAKQAVRGRDSTLEAEAWLALLANYAGTGHARVQEGLIASRVAALAVERANGDDAMRARLATNAAWAERIAGNESESFRQLQQAADLVKRSLGAKSLAYTAVLSQIGITLSGLGRLHESLAYNEQVLAIRRAILRPDHPSIAAAMSQVGIVLMLRGRLQEGLQMVQSALAILARELGREHPSALVFLQAVAYTESYLGNHQRALSLYATVISSRKRLFDPHDVLLGKTYWFMGEAQKRAGLGDKAEQTFQQLIERNSQAGVPNHIGTADALVSLGQLHNSRRQHGRALSECRRGLDILLPSVGLDSPRLIDAYECIGEALIGTRDFEGARRELERVPILVDRGGMGPQWTASARFQLARTLWATPSDRPRAKELVRTTLNELTAAEGDNRELIARIKAWRSAHPD